MSKWPDLNGVLILIVETTRLRDNMANKQSAQSAKSGVLCGEDIKAHHLITEDTFDEKSLQDASYDLRLGEAHYVYGGDIRVHRGGESTPQWKLYYIGGEEKKAFKTRRADWKFEECHDKILRIPGYGSAIVQLYETVDTFSALNLNSRSKKSEREHSFIVGRFDLKLKRVYQALISQQATQVEIGYQGKLFCFVHNLSDNEIELHYKDTIATIEFSYVNAEQGWAENIINTVKEKNKKKYSNYSPFTNVNGIEDIRYFVSADRLPADCGFARTTNRINSEIQAIPKHIANYFSEYNNITRVGNQVQSYIDNKSKTVQTILSLILVLFSLGILSTLLAFQQELYARQVEIEFLETQISSLLQTPESAQLEQFDSKINYISTRHIVIILLCLALVILALGIVYYLGRHSQKASETTAEVADDSNTESS